MPPLRFTSAAERRRRNELRVRGTAEMTVDNARWAGTVTQQIRINPAFTGQGCRLGGRNVGIRNSHLVRPNVVRQQEPRPQRNRRTTARFAERTRTRAANLPSSPPDEPDDAPEAEPGEFQVHQLEVPENVSYVFADMGGHTVDGGMPYSLRQLNGMRAYQEVVVAYNTENNINFPQEVYERYPWLLD